MGGKICRERNEGGIRGFSGKQGLYHRSKGSRMVVKDLSRKRQGKVVKDRREEMIVGRHEVRAGAWDKF